METKRQLLFFHVAFLKAFFSAFLPNRGQFTLKCIKLHFRVPHLLDCETVILLWHTKQQHSSSCWEFVLAVVLGLGVGPECCQPYLHITCRFQQKPPYGESHGQRSLASSPSGLESDAVWCGHIDPESGPPYVALRSSS